MNLTAPLVLYCERQGPTLLAEPLNALSNLAFFYFAGKLWTAAARTPASRTRLRGLAVLMALVGAGSLAFHTFATVWASILDVAFIGLFNLAYLALFLAMVARWRGWRVAGAAAGFLVVDRSAAFLGLAGVLYGSGMYLPPLAALLALTAYALHLAPAAGRMMAVACGAFLLSLTARTMDPIICGAFPLGSHFLWHLLNAWVLYRLSRALQAGAAKTA